MVTKRSKLYPAVKLCQSMIDYYNPSFLDYISESEYDFIQLYELKKMTSDEELRFYSYVTSFLSSHYDNALRLAKFFYDERAIKIDHATLLYLSIMDKLFQSYLNIPSYSITDIYYNVDFDYIFIGFPFYDCLPVTFGDKLSFKLKNI